VHLARVHCRSRGWRRRFYFPPRQTHAMFGSAAPVVRPLRFALGRLCGFSNRARLPTQDLIFAYNSPAVRLRDMRSVPSSPWVDGLNREVAMQFEQETLGLLPAALQVLEAGFAALPEAGLRVPGKERMAQVMQEVASRLRDNYPYFHPLYAGQMLKPPHPIARAAYALATWINPNNHALDGGRASSAMEKEAVAEIAAMFGWQAHLGHLTSGGTMANLEALWVAGSFIPGRRSWPPSRPTIRTPESAACWVCGSRRRPVTSEDGWTLKPSRNCWWQVISAVL